MLSEPAPSPPIVPRDGVTPIPPSGEDMPVRLVPDRALELRVRDAAFRRVPDREAVLRLPPERLLVFLRLPDERLLVFLRPPEERLLVFLRPPDERELVFLRPPEREAVLRVPDERLLVFLRPPDERLLVFLRAPVERLLVFLRPPDERDDVFLRLVVERDVVFLRPPDERLLVFLRPPLERDVVFLRAPVERVLVRRAEVERAAVLRRVVDLRVLPLERVLEVFLRALAIRAPPRWKRFWQRHVQYARYLGRHSATTVRLLLGDVLHDVPRLRVGCVQRDVSLGDDSDQLAVLLDDRQTTHLMSCHQPERFVEVLLRIDGDELA